MTTLSDHDQFTPEAIEARAQSFLDTLSPATRADVEGKIATLRYHESCGCLWPELYVGKTVLDWEAGMGGFSGAFYCLGARDIVAIDSWVAPEVIAPELRACSAIRFQQIPIIEFAQARGADEQPFDLVFSNTVTEHITDLPGSFDMIRRLMTDSGAYLNVHDNYYSPCGSHDHGFWFYGDAGRITFQGVDCWARAEKCDASAEHRERLLKQMPWTWNDRLEARRDPPACTTCPYFRRSQPWGHLASVDTFVHDFEDRSFFTLRGGSSLNKFTTFQLRQFLNEASLKVIRFHRNRATNAVPVDLLESGFSPLELTTTTSVWLCAKGPVY